MDPKLNSILQSIMTHAEPLGPIDHNRVLDDSIAKILLCDQVSPFKDINSKSYMILLGRKGAGKSAMLTETRLHNTKGRKPQLTNQNNLPDEGSPFLIQVMSWTHFHKIVRNVCHHFREDELVSELIPPEYYANLWYEMLWDEIIQHFYKYSHYAHHDLGPVADFINADSCFVGSPKDTAKRLFEDARSAILSFLEKRESRLYFLFDSMEDYPIRNGIFSRVLVGLFQALNMVNTESQYVVISFCIPEEIESFLTQNSANLLKDFASSYRIRWRPIDLLRITAHRFRISMKIHDVEFYNEIRSYDFKHREDIHKLFARILPRSVTNSLGIEEDPLAFIVRHTQLLPRHMLVTFNSILSGNYYASGGFRLISEAEIRDRAIHAQKTIADQILHLYQKVYPKLIAACREILPDLNPICSFSELKKIEKRFKQRIEDDIISVWETLFQMGVIGIAINSQPASDRYCYANFHFNNDRAFGMATDSEYCFHPVFSRAFGIPRRNTGDRRVVYPANIEMVTLND